MESRNTIIMERFLFICILVLGLSACTPTQTRQAAPVERALSNVDAAVVYLDSQEEILPVNQFPSKLTLIFPFIPGALFGRPSSDPVFQIELDGGRSFRLNLEQAVAALDAGARPLTEGWMTRGLSVRPRRARIARIGTFALNPRRQQGIGGVGFIEVASGDPLILVYADRACTISGVLDLSGTRYRHEIALPGPGFHWVRLMHDGAESLLKYYAKPETVNFAIKIVDLTNV